MHTIWQQKCMHGPATRESVLAAGFPLPSVQSRDRFVPKIARQLTENLYFKDRKVEEIVSS